MASEDSRCLEERLSRDAAPHDSLTSDEREAITALFDGAPDAPALSELGAVAEKALAQFGENLRAHYATALYQEFLDEPEEAGKGFYHLCRQLARKEEWEGARELALRALPLRPDYRVVRVLLEARAHLAESPEMADDLATAESFCPDSPDLLWLQAREADGEGRLQEAEGLACDALNEFIAVKDVAGAEAPLLRILDSESAATHRYLLKIVGRMADAGMVELVDATLGLAETTLADLSLQGDVAKVLAEMILKRKAFEHLRGPYVRALVGSLKGGPELEAFANECGLGDPHEPFDRALQRFREMSSLRPGAFIEHTNFGVGRIASHDGAFLVIDFTDKPGHRMALEIATRSLRPLHEGCLRVARFGEPETIAHEIEHDPVAILVRALTDLGGEASARELRDCLASGTIPADDWSTWWKRAREAAQRDPRIDTSHAFRQSYRIPTGDEEEGISLAALPAKGGAHSATTLIWRFLKQHPELGERAREEYAQQLALRAVAGSRGEGVAAVPLLMRWLPGRANEWEAIAAAAFRSDPGVAGGVTAEDQGELLELGLRGGNWQDAALTGLSSRFPAVRQRSLAALRERLGEGLLGALREVLLSRRGGAGPKLAIVRLGLSGALGENALGVWELLIGALTMLSSNLPQKLRRAALGIIDPQEELARLLSGADRDEEMTDRLRVAVDDLALSETGLEPLVLILSASGHGDLVREVRGEAEAGVADPVAIHFDPKVTLMTRKTYDKAMAKTRDLERQLATTIPREIGAARSLGDLSENAEYHAARERQGIADATLRSLRSQTENARVIEDLYFPEDTAAVGTEVVVRDLSDQSEQAFWLLGQGDSIQDGNVINYLAPLGQALVGKRPGDTIEFDANGQGQRLEVLSVRRRLL